MLRPLVLCLFFISLVSSKWHYQCTQRYCVKTQTTANTTNPLSFAECNFLCLDYAGVWPKPTQAFNVSNLADIDIAKFTYTTTENTTVADLVASAFELFTKKIKKLLPCKALLNSNKNSTKMEVHLNFDITEQEVDRFTFGVSESYKLDSTLLLPNNLYVTVSAGSFFGARHALETLAQLVVYDDLRNRTLFPAQISIADGPVYSWRGILLDTARNYITPKALKRTIRAMAASKLNTLHWHLTDTASFPYVSKSHPELHENGAYTTSKIYSDETVRDLIDYAKVRGVRVVPEFDSPAHVGEGWQDSGVVTCFNWKPWSDYCVEPPCGQFDPSKSELYDILEDLYGDLLDQFGTEVFHMGGDEVNIDCWNQTEDLTKWMVEQGWDLTSENYYNKVWPYFQNEASARLYKKAGKEIPIILWTSDLTSLANVTEILPPSKYIIQVWTTSYDAAIQTLLEQNYTLILSNYDALYLDCGLPGWVTDGNNWCTPYKGWQKIYDDTPSSIAGERKSQFLGGEVALWTEESGTSSLDTRLWPRAAAFAETLWTEPSTSWEEAQERMLLHRERLVSLGVEAEEIQPEWCFRHQQSCPTYGKLNL